MSWAWTRTFYASSNGTIYNFEMKRQRDDAVKHHGFEKVLATDAWKHYPNIVRVGWRDYGRFIANAPTIIEAERVVAKMRTTEENKDEGIS